MKVLMINSNRYNLPAPVIPFGLCQVSAAIEKSGHELRVLDLCFSRNCRNAINKSLKQFQPDIIGISIRNIDTGATYEPLFFLETVKEEIIDPVKKLFNGPIVIGGASVGISGTEMLEFFDLEFAIRGDGETAMTEFIRRIEKKRSLKGLGGLLWRKNNKIVEENPPLVVNDLDSLPLFKPHRYIDIEKYQRLGAPIPVQTKRGCSLSCVYCTYNIVEGHKVRLRSPQLIADEIEQNVKETGNKNFEFTDSAFNIPLEHSKNVLRAIIARNLDIKLQTMGFNPGSIDKEFAKLLKKANFKEIQLGVEAGCNISLRNLNKNFKKADILRAGKILRDTGIPIMWWILTGAPGETERTLTETFETIKKAASKWDLIVVGNGIRAYKGAPITESILHENPGFSPDNFLRPIAFSPKTMSLQAIRNFNKRIALHNPNFLFFDEVQRIPFTAAKIQNTLMKLIAPHKPWWKSFIFMNYIKKFLGFTSIQQLIFQLKNLNTEIPMKKWEEAEAMR